MKGFLGDSAGRESACNVGDLGSIAGLGRFLIKKVNWRKENIKKIVRKRKYINGIAYPFYIFCLQNELPVRAYINIVLNKTL